MPPEIEQEPCPYCGSPAIVVYDRLRRGDGTVGAEHVQEMRCTNPRCPGEDANQAAAGIVRKATEGS